MAKKHQPFQTKCGDWHAHRRVPLSLRPDQTGFGDEAVAKILSSKLELPGKAKLALMKFPDTDESGYGRYRWREEQCLKLQQEHVDRKGG